MIDKTINSIFGRLSQTNSPRGFEQWMTKIGTISNAQFGKSRGFLRVK
jgi:hypothetical protein